MRASLPRSPASSPARRLDRSASAVSWPGGLVTVAGVLHLLSEGHSPDDVAGVFPGLGADWLARAAEVARDALIGADVEAFALDAELAELAGDEMVDTVMSVTGWGDDPELVAVGLARRVLRLPRPLIVVVEGGEPGRDHLYGQLIHTDVGVVAEVVSNAYLPAEEPLSSARVKAALALGWHAPDVGAGDPNFWRDDIGEGHLADALWRILVTLETCHGVERWEPLRLCMRRAEINYEVSEHEPFGPRIRPTGPE